MCYVSWCLPASVVCVTCLLLKGRQTVARCSPLRCGFCVNSISPTRELVGSVPLNKMPRWLICTVITGQFYRSKLCRADFSNMQILIYKLYPFICYTIDIQGSLAFWTQSQEPNQFWRVRETCIMYIIKQKLKLEIKSLRGFSNAY